MFEITPRDIAQLDDKQLRSLVALLCEAEMRQRGYSTAAVTWGGDQNAKDGGLDVRVSLPEDQPIDGFVARRVTGFQVKRQDMPPAAVLCEMCPKGELRPTIRELAESDGAYIIVSSEGSVSDSALSSRKKAMANAAEGLNEPLMLDFYDRTRLATWVRQHAGIAIWARRAIGRAIAGWEPFDAWAYPAAGTGADYLLENGVRIRDRAKPRNEDLSAAEGLKQIREILRESASVVRLVGLSGVGKTRFVQALFDERVGDDALDPSLAVYANMGNEPNPQPFSLVSDLIANRTRAIVIVDNCASELHTRLTALAKSPGSSISVLTVEYDIQDDLPEGTEAFEVRAASTELIEKLLRTRFSTLSQVDARTAAEFSGGNARIAIALAETVKRDGTLARLNDSQLFERLFTQRQDKDQSLLKMAQACALVYSFDGEDLEDGKDAEMIRIAGLVGGTAQTLHANVAELCRRELAQRRGRWRAILPHAVANRLAATALQDIPVATVAKYLTRDAPERLTISFARRLGYLDTSEEATNLVREWLAPKGWIGEHVWTLNKFGKSIFENCLPAGPEMGIAALEANLPAHDADTRIETDQYVLRALRLLAWDAGLFERASALLAILAAYSEEKIAKEASEIHTSLFQIFLSGTHATVEQRVRVVKKLLNSALPKEQELGVQALRGMLRCQHFSSNYDFQFGARSRDYGLYPRTNDEIASWYTATLEIVDEFAFSENAARAEIETVFAESFRGLWTLVGLHDRLEELVKRIEARVFWADGWRAVKETRHYDEKDRASLNYARLTKLEELLRPRDLVQRVKGKVLSSKLYDLDEIDTNYAETFRIAMERQQAEARSLGREVANNPDALKELLPEILGGGGNVWQLGRGLAEASQDQTYLWRLMVERFASLPKEKRDTGALCGFLVELEARKSPLVEELLEDALESDALSSYFPILQASASLTVQSLDRLNRSLELAKAPIKRYSNIYLSRALAETPAADVADYVLSVALRPDGEQVAVDALYMQFFDDRQSKRTTAIELIDAGRTILRNMDFGRPNRIEYHHLQPVVDLCASGDDGRAVASDICEKLRQAAAEHKSYGFDNAELLKSLCKLQPKTVLDTLMTGGQDVIDAGVNLLNQAAQFDSSPIDGIADDLLFDWCAEDPTNRFQSVAKVVTPFSAGESEDPTAWNTTATRLIHDAPDPLAVLEILAERFRPMMWGGSLSTILEIKAGILDQFDDRGNEALASFIARQQQILREEAKETLEWETSRDRNRDERFE